MCSKSKYRRLIVVGLQNSGLKLQHPKLEEGVKMQLSH